jgi:hypothetical protein
LSARTRPPAFRGCGCGCGCVWRLDPPGPWAPTKGGLRRETQKHPPGGIFSVSWGARWNLEPPAFASAIKCHQTSKEHIQLGWVVRWVLSTPPAPGPRATPRLGGVYVPCQCQVPVPVPPLSAINPPPAQAHPPEKAPRGEGAPPGSTPSRSPARRASGGG